MPTDQPNGAGTQSSQRLSRLESDLGRQLRYLVRSMEPAIVFSSLAHLCVPTFSDGCTVDIVEADDAAYRISYPRSDLDNVTDFCSTWATNEFAVRTRFASAGYTGMMTHHWRTRAPTPTDVSRALLLVRHGVDIVREERQEAHRRPDNDALGQPEAISGALDPADVALLEARARRLRHWARCETQHIAGRWGSS